MTVQLEVISQPEVVGILYRFLGPDRAWSDFLADCARVRHNTNYHGLQLPPTCRLKPPDDRCSRPFYAVPAVAEFIAAALKKQPAGKPDRRLIRQKRVIELDPAALDVHHSMRQATLIS